MIQPDTRAQELPLDGLVVVLKQDCPTCQLVVPVLEQIKASGADMVVVSQDDPRFPAGLEPVDDRELLRSHELGVEIVPTLIERRAGESARRAIGWHRSQWRSLTGLDDLGSELPEARPGCGALNLEPVHAERLAERDHLERAQSRAIHLGDHEDPIEACYARGWSDGLPVVPPTPARVANMLAGTGHRGDEVIGDVAPDYAPCTVEKVAINAVMAGCRPPVPPRRPGGRRGGSRATIFNWHGLAATTYFAGPVVDGQRADLRPDRNELRNQCPRPG